VNKETLEVLKEVHEKLIAAGLAATDGIRMVLDPVVKEAQELIDTKQYEKWANSIIESLIKLTEARKLRWMHPTPGIYSHYVAEYAGHAFYVYYSGSGSPYVGCIDPNSPKLEIMDLTVRDSILKMYEYPYGKKRLLHLKNLIQRHCGIQGKEPLEALADNLEKKVNRELS
jgi:hypothetical protein